MDEAIIEKRDYLWKERLLLPAALAIGILFDRLIFARLWSGYVPFTGAGVFWLCYLALFYAFYWERLRRNGVLWFIAGCAAMLCCWNFLYTGNAEYGFLTFLVVPAVLMAHAVMTAGDYRPKDTGGMAAAWFSGWFVKPFSGLPAMAGATGSLLSGGRRGTAVKVIIGAGVTLPLLFILLPLLGGADQVFGHYLSKIAESWDLQPLVGHSLLAVIAAMLFYSFLWNIGFGKKTAVQPVTAEIDRVVSRVVLGAVALLYLLFCGVQFTYLFAGAGLPEGITYAEYAREGFAQTVAVCAINLLIFGVFLRFSAKDRAVSILLAALLGLTGVMLFSGFARLRLYIDAFGMTWLRLISAWFILYLAAVIVICAVRMLRKGLPAILLCGLLLLAWYVALGYANPDGFVAWYNQAIR
ncbi:MAG: DUF4173 domain-containing protein [Oscillospiraceae bacterium]|jgi:hypothetical protein|nr:DUF4173 domain-containing protein [Oscillospiraceae bacterium]